MLGLSNQEICSNNYSQNVTDAVAKTEEELSLFLPPLGTIIARSIETEESLEKRVRFIYQIKKSFLIIILRA